MLRLGPAVFVAGEFWPQGAIECAETRQGGERRGRDKRAFVAVGIRVSAAAIHSVSTTTVVGLDEIRGSAPDHFFGLLALGK